MNPYSVINKKGKELFTDVTLHPGEVLLMELEARDIRKTAFAAQVGMRPSHLSELLHGKRPLSAAMAIKLEKLLGIDAAYWMRVQVYYDLYIERNKATAAA